MDAEPSPQAPESAPPTLEYAKRTRLAWISRHRILLISIALLLAIAAPIAWYWVPLTHRVLWITRSRRAAAHVMPRGLPISIIGPEATEVIHEFVVGRTLEATLEELVHTIHAHPTVSEAALEATLAALGQAIHL